MPLMVFLGLPGPVVNGTNRVAILIQNASAVLGFLRQGFSDFRLSLSLTLCALPGTILGAVLVLLVWRAIDRRRSSSSGSGEGHPPVTPQQ